MNLDKGSGLNDLDPRQVMKTRGDTCGASSMIIRTGPLVMGRSSVL